MSTSLRVVLVLLGISIIGLAITGSIVYSRMAYVWGFLIVANWIWSRLSLRDVQVSRRARVQRAQVGLIFEERFDIQNQSRIPRLWLEIKDDSPLPGSAGSQVLALVRGREVRTYLSRTLMVQRGVFPLGPTEVISGDPFGLFPVHQQLPAQTSLLVYPMMVDVRLFPNPPGLLSGGEAMRRPTPEATSNAAGVREYAPGDAMNRIHWLSTARRARLMVKEFELDPLSDVWLFLDAEKLVQSVLPHELPRLTPDRLWKPMAEIQLPPSTEEYAVSIAASLGRYFLRRNRSVGLVANGQSYTVLPPDRGARQLNKLLEALALLRAVGQMPFSALVTAHAMHLTRGSTVVMITPSVRREIPLTVDFLLRRGLLPVVILVDSQTFSGPPGSKEIEHAIRGMDVPNCRVENGADLEVVLNHVSV